MSFNRKAAIRRLLCSRVDWNLCYNITLHGACARAIVRAQAYASASSEESLMTSTQCTAQLNPLRIVQGLSRENSSSFCARSFLWVFFSLPGISHLILFTLNLYSLRQYKNIRLAGVCLSAGASMHYYSEHDSLL